MVNYSYRVIWFRALKRRPEMDDRTMRYARELSEMIRHETVSVSGQTDLTKFHEFHELLRRLFPHIFGACSFEEHEGSFIMCWK